MFAVMMYVAAISAANLTAAHFGPIATPFNAFFLIGLDMAIRNRLHEIWRDKYLPVRMSGLILVASAISYCINPASGQIAIASLVAFALSTSFDASIYQALIRRKFVVKANIGNGVGAAVDSFTFPLIAFGSFMPEIVAAQFLAKVAGGALFSYLIARLASRWRVNTQA